MSQFRNHGLPRISKMFVERKIAPAPAQLTSMKKMPGVNYNSQIAAPI